MGIQGLLPLLKSIHDSVHIAAYANQRVAVDTYVWLHRGTYACATELCLGRPTERYLDYCLSLVDLLLHYKVTPVMVLDGACLPQKKVTEDKRRISRQANKAKGRVCYEEGNHAAAMKFFQKAVDITPEMAHKLLHHLRLRGVEFIVAPYEADAQLAYLSLSNYVAAVISEDSDLLVFGCKRVFYKMDKQGHGIEIRLANIAANEPFNFTNWTQAMLQMMAVLSGCDYLPSLEGMGIKKAYQEVQQNKTLERILGRLRADGRFTFPPNYEEQFKMAVMTFNYQRVFDPISRRLISLHPLPSDLHTDSDFLGPIIPDEVAEQIAMGLIHPDNHRPFESNQRRSPSPRFAPSLAALSLPPRLSSSPSSSSCSPALPPLLNPLPPSCDDFFAAVAEYTAGGSDSNALFPGLKPLSGLASTPAAQRPFVRPGLSQGAEKSLNSGERWSQLFQKSRNGDHANKENERVQINLLEDDDDDEKSVLAKEQTIKHVSVDLLVEEKAIKPARAPRVGLAKSALISSRSRLTVPRTSGLLGGAASDPHALPSSLAKFSFSTSSTSVPSISNTNTRDTSSSSPPSSKHIREVVDMTSPSPPSKRLHTSENCDASPLKNRHKLARVNTLPLSEASYLPQPHSASPKRAMHSLSPARPLLFSPHEGLKFSRSSSRKSSAPDRVPFSFPPSFCFSTSPRAIPYSKPFDYTVIDDCPSPHSELDEDALTPTRRSPSPRPRNSPCSLSLSPRSPCLTVRKSRSVLSPPDEEVCIAESPPTRRRFSLKTLEVAAHIDTR